LLAGDHEDDNTDAWTRKLTEFLREKREEIRRLLERAEELGRVLQSERPPFVLCHADIHLANLLVDRKDRLHIVDRDQPIIAPKERDLLFIVGTGVGGFVEGSTQEEAFFRGYREAEINRVALAYFRYKWAIQDIGAYAESAYFMSDSQENTKRAAVEGLIDLFEPGRIVAVAYRSEAHVVGSSTALPRV
jgi:spectinomycin phosphotransferase